MSLRKIKSELNKMEQDELIEFIIDLYNRMPNVKTYLNLAYTNKYDKFIEKSRRKIERLVYPTGREMKINDKEARRFIKEINQMHLPEISCELEFYYVEYATEVIRDFGLVNDSFYKSIHKAFYNGVQYVNKMNNHNKYDRRIEELISNAYEQNIELEY